MTDIGSLREIIGDGALFLDREPVGIVERQLLETLVLRSEYDVVEVVTGVRRSGKSTILQCLGRKLREAGRRVDYVNFEDERFSPKTTDLADMTSLLDLDNSVLLIDEPQNMPGWERWVRRMHDRGMKIYLTGSNSKLLGREISTTLAGRKRTHGIFPFSFQEYLRAGTSDRIPADQLVRKLEEYLTRGGFPYPTVTGDHSILKDYREDIIERDVLLRHRVANPFRYRDLIRFLMSNPGVYLSSRSVKGFLEISHPTLKKYLGYLEEAYAVISLEKFARSQKVRIQNPKKVYPVDNGLLIKRDDKGHLLESCVVQHILRETDDVFYWKDERGREVDLYLPEEKLAVQVVYELNEGNLKREEAPLASAETELDSTGIIVYMYSRTKSEYPQVRASEILHDGTPIENLKRAGTMGK